ncbi:MAG: glutamate--tRNA ligase [Duodenibacillus sp.]|nr:glutamate--tRNA ligase [Duodenibacillus sp.]HBC69539.1 glutamate--tRNA ligase [Sutterella sp.]
MTEIRTRIAPSPTGMMHLGTARTAIYCWAVARHLGGKFLLRIEDTDQKRSTAEATQVILDSMKWLNLDYDEGPIYQMDRLDRYRELVDQMLADGRAYKCYATPEELDEMREAQRAAGIKPRYDGRWRPENAVGKQIPEGVKPVIRFRNPDDGDVSWNDAVYGPITISNRELDDLIIMRDGIPTYNFAVVVDDWDMKVSHVIRGADHINNTPRQINLYKALGAPVPVFAHLPLINGPDGQKLSKRHGSVSVMEYEARGFLPEAVFNYLARLGWGHGNMEKFTREELAEVFELSGCSRAAARIDFKKFEWLNAQYMKEADDKRLADLVAPRIQKRGGTIEGHADLAGVCNLLKSRCATLEVLAESAMLFYKPLERDAAAVKAALEGENRVALEKFVERVKSMQTFTAAEIYGAIKAVMEEMGIKMGPIATPLRVLVCAADRTPQIDRTLELFGKDEVLARIASGLAMAA